MSDFCEIVLDPQRLGNAAADIASLDQWSFSPGNTFDLGVLSLVGTFQPYIQRRNYKTVQTARGECQLEMRVYSSHPAVKPQQPLIALHGGSWQHRASGFLGIEAMAAHFTQSGFVVFAPFYRLIGVEDGNNACNDATLYDALSDAEAALDWVLEFGGAFGASGKPTLFGQSAGGHLAAALAVNRAVEVKQAVLFYAPTDFTDFAEQILDGSYTGTQGRRIMEAVIGTDIDSLSLDDPLIQNNTFPSIIAAQPGAYPPFFLLHGGADDLLPYRQSVRLCNALSGNPESAAQTDGLMSGLSNARDVIQCDARGSQLHLLKEGDHALDFCIAPELCNAGSEESARLAADSVQQMLDWINPPPAPLEDSAEDGIETMASGSMEATLLVILMLITLVRIHNSALKRRVQGNLQ